ncbi:MAG TPA: radical SAM protein [Fimbriimonadaceae bacterium]|nr:radical SAM protein [Fimbriimonadaceae bacterium]
MLQLALFDDGRPQAPDEFAHLRLRELPHAKILTKPSGSARDFDYTLNPYIGCGFNCSYCFATFFQADDERRESWGRWVDVKVDAARQLIKKHDLCGKRIFMSSATDPYQPLEAKVGLTRAILEVLVEKQPRLVVQTRGPLVTRDIDLLRRLEHVRVNMSITTDDEEVRKAFEPSCASIERRLEALTKVKEAGIRTTVCMVPMLPLRDPQRWAKRVRATNADHFAASYFRIVDIPFAASTRAEALEIAKQMRWDRAAYDRAVAELRKHLPELNREGGYEP